MYHADRKALGWGSLLESKFGTRVSKEDLADFGDNSQFAQVMKAGTALGRWTPETFEPATWQYGHLLLLLTFIEPAGTHLVSIIPTLSTITFQA